MDQRNGFAGTRADLMTCIQALLALDCYSVLSARDLGRSALSLLAAAEKELAAAHSRIAELEAENAGLALDKLTARTAPDGITIFPTEHSTDQQGFQHYSAKLSEGGKLHFYAVRVVKMINADGPDARVADHFAAIERRLLAGNPVEV
ncbi:hypothetical protein [Burkholderia phage CSP3]|nr:hypothetical protein [Burkholderia phage CSP3]